MEYTLRNIKTAPSRNGLSMTCTFIIDGIPVADFVDLGDGSEPNFYRFRYKTNRAQLLFEQWENDLENAAPEFMIWAGEFIKMSKSLFIDLLHACIANNKPFLITLKTV